MARDLLRETRVHPHDEQAEGGLELAQRRLELPLLEVCVAARGMRQAALEAGALEGGERRQRQRPGEKHNEPGHEHQRDGQEHQRHEPRRHAGSGRLYGNAAG